MSQYEANLGEVPVDRLPAAPALRLLHELRQAAEGFLGCGLRDRDRHIGIEPLVTRVGRILAMIT